MSDHYEERRARRERIATACLTGLIAVDANPSPRWTPACQDVGGAAELAVTFADALIAVLDAPPPMHHLPGVP